MTASSNSLLYYVVYLIVSGFSVLLTSKLVAGFKVSGFAAAIMAAIVIGFANAFIWPVLIFLTLPINILTLGLFTFVVNGAVIKIAAALLPGFKVDSWLSAIFGSLILSVISTILHWLI